MNQSDSAEYERKDIFDFTNYINEEVAHLALK